MLGATAEPFYFGTAAKLFGCYHAPQTTRVRDCAVVLCYPAGQEYIRAHRSYRQLALQLSQLGFPVLRFDFYACGDSDGECSEGTLREWFNNIGSAMAEMRRRCGLLKLCLVGLRLGGTLSLTVGAERGDIQRMVLWDPVVSGMSYLEELTALHQERVRHSLGTATNGATRDGPAELLGFPITARMLADLQKIEISTIAKKPANDILILSSSDETSHARLNNHLQALGARVELQPVPGVKIWIEKNKTVVPHQILRAIAAWICRVSP
jgi:pimeloyl-ACP methyl ester carboxylesterase